LTRQLSQTSLVQSQGGSKNPITQFGQKHYCVTYDSAGSDIFVVTDATNSLKLHFKPTKNGLYALRGPSTDWQEKWSLVNTVSDNKNMYTKRELKAVARARQFQNIIMFPSTRELMDFSDQHLLKNNPVQRADIKDAEKIYCTNLGSLKGKTATRKGITVASQITGVPPVIKQKYKNVTLCIDLLFVNKIPFLLMISRRLHFGSVENLNNRQVPTIRKGLHKVLAQYKRRGFHITAIHTDPEFEPLQAVIEHIQFNFCAQNEHVSEIERFIRTVKDRARSGYNSLPSKRIPRLILIRLVSNSVF
jgi:hypothetical protein